MPTRRTSPDFSGLYFTEGPLQLRNQRKEKLDLVAVRHQHNHGDGEAGDRLLKAQALICGHEGVKLTFGQAQQLTVLL